MESNHRPYDYNASFGRIRGILNQPDINYTEQDSFPGRESLTYSNGFYANCSALFIDIRGSSKLPSKYRRPTLARLYRAYISEVVAILNSDLYCRELNIVGDGAWAVYDAIRESDIDDVFVLACKLNSMIKVLNYELVRKKIDQIKVGIGLSYGRALMIKAGYAGSGLNDVVYMGDVVNAAAKLAAQGNQGLFDQTIVMDGAFRQNLNEANKKLSSWNSFRNCWNSSALDVEMEEWYRYNCPRQGGFFR